MGGCSGKSQNAAKSPKEAKSPATQKTPQQQLETPESKEPRRATNGSSGAAVSSTAVPTSTEPRGKDRGSSRTGTAEAQGVEAQQGSSTTAASDAPPKGREQAKEREREESAQAAGQPRSSEPTAQRDGADPKQSGVLQDGKASAAPSRGTGDHERKHRDAEQVDPPQVKLEIAERDDDGNIRPSAKRKLADKATTSRSPEEEARGDAKASASSPSREGLSRQKSMGSLIRRSALTLDSDKKLDDVYIVADLNKIGKGSFGKVVKATNRLTNVLRAVKSINKQEKLEVERVRQEVKIGRMLDHPNVVKLWEVFEDSSCIFLVMELCTGGPLSQHCKKSQCIEERQAILVAQQLMYAVNYMHTNFICHRDVKPDNLLLLTKDPIENGILKVADFGLSKRFTPGQALTTLAGTIVYSAPEVFGGSYSESSDVWSCGVTLYHLLSGQLPFTGNTGKDVVAKIQRGNYTFKASAWETVTDGTKDLVRGLLKYDRDNRWTAGQALLHDGLQSVTPKGARAAYLSLAECLGDFLAAKTLKRLALQVIAQQLSETQVKELRSIFLRLDVLGVGSLDKDMLLTEFKKHSIPLDRPPGTQHDPKMPPPPGGWPGRKLRDIIEDVCPITYTAFLAMAMEAKHIERDEVLLAAFRFLDRNGDGFISQDDLSSVVRVEDGGNGEAQEAVASAASGSPPVTLEADVGLQEFKAIVRGHV